MASVMMRPPRTLVRQYHIPKDVIAEAYGRPAPSRDATRASLRKSATSLRSSPDHTGGETHLEGVRHLDEPAAASAER